MQRRSSMNKRIQSSSSMDRKQLNKTKRVGSINGLINTNDDNYIDSKKPLQLIEAVKTVRINSKVNNNNGNNNSRVNDSSKSDNDNNNNRNKTTNNNNNNQLNSTTKHINNNNNDNTNPLTTKTNPTLSSPQKSKPSSISKLTSIPLSITNA